VDLRELAAEPFVLCERESSPALYEKVMELCAEAGFTPRIANTSEVWRSIVMLVQAGEGIALLPMNLQHQRMTDLAFCPLKAKDASVELVMAWSPGRDTPMLESFRKMVHATRQRI
jgi:DNA-binding transcriptional LysR family regulator